MKTSPRVHCFLSSDPYVKIWLYFGNTKVEKKKTNIKMRSLNPVYNESFIFEIPWEKIREASLEVTVMDFDKVGRNEMIGKVILGCRSGPMETRHWNDMVAKPRQQVAQWHLLKDWPSCPPTLPATTNPSVYSAVARMQGWPFLFPLPGEWWTQFAAKAEETRTPQPKEQGFVPSTQLYSSEFCWACIQCHCT